jgi:flagellar biosynthesis/type III secretory pathway protein FliH
METENKMETTLTRQQNTLRQISQQVEMALQSDNTPEAVKDCLKTIIIEASGEAGMTLADFSLVRAALPNIIENLNFEYGRGVLHSIHAIIRYDTDAFQKFYDDGLDRDDEEQTTKPKYPELEKNFQQLIQKFDRFSPEGKQKMIDSFGRVRQQLKAESGEDLSEVVEETIEEVKSFFEQRLAATL